MNKKRILTVLSVAILLLSSFVTTHNTFASVIQLNGAQANDATVTTKDGQNVTNDDSLDRYQTLFE